MKKIIILSLVVVLLMGISFSACSAKEFKPKAEYTMTVNVNPAFGWGMSAQKWCDIIAEKTGGKINVKPYWGSQLLAGKQMNWFQAVAEGSVDFAVESTINSSSVVKSHNLFSLPFFINTYENLDKIEYGETGKKMFAEMEKMQVKALAWGENGFRQLTNNIRPVRTPEDMKGLRLRVCPTPIYDDIFKQLGADPIHMNWGDAVTGFQQGAVDGQENPYGVLLPVKIWEYHKYATNWNYLVDPLLFVVNKRVWDSFPEDIQIIIKEAAEEAGIWEKAFVRRGLDGDISINILKETFGETPEISDQVAYVKSKGTEVVELTEAELRAFKEATKPVLDKWIDEVGTDFVVSAKLDMAK
ncbi:MAG: DctP family TRAP transporter solute-binding subunit [Candidatus Caldatribacteriota bacterium]|nr:DctP family TRAP transporter solute-binding subunit [Candidatus Caldatribacteriota bacterium]